MKNIRFQIYALFLLILVFSGLALYVDYNRHKDFLQIIAEKKHERSEEQVADDLAGEIPKNERAIKEIVDG